MAGEKDSADKNGVKSLLPSEGGQEEDREDDFSRCGIESVLGTSLLTSCH